MTFAFNVKSESVVAQSQTTLCNPMDCSPAVPLFMDFSRHEYWSGLPFPSPGDLPNPGIQPKSPALQADSLLSEPQLNNCKGFLDINYYFIKLMVGAHGEEIEGSYEDILGTQARCQGGCGLVWQNKVGRDVPELCKGSGV